MNRRFEVLTLSNRQTLTNFRTALRTEVLPILGALKWGFSLGVSQLCKNFGLNWLFFIIVVPIFLGGWQDNLLGEWAILGNGQVEFTGWVEQALFPRTSASSAKRCTEAGARRIAPRPSRGLTSHIRLTQMVVDMIWFG